MSLPSDRDELAESGKGQPNRAPVRVLSLDGGGIRGLIAVRVLEALERAVAARRIYVGLPPKPLAEHFDLLAGTSTGGLLALGLGVCRKPESRQPLCDVSDLLDFYRRLSVRAFQPSGRWALGGLLAARFDHRRYEAVLAVILEDRQLSHALRPLLLPSYDIGRRNVRVFRSRLAKRNPDEDYLLRVVARSITAAPTYYRAVRASPVTGSRVEHLIDGGVYANNPALLAYTEAHRLYGWERPVCIISIGTGQVNRPLPPREVAEWALVGWLNPLRRVPLIDVMMDGQTDSVDRHLNDLLAGVRGYYRFDPALAERHAEIGDVSPRNLQGLEEAANRMLQEREHLLAEAARALVEPDACKSLTGQNPT